MKKSSRLGFPLPSCQTVLVTFLILPVSILLLTHWRSKDDSSTKHAASTSSKVAILVVSAWNDSSARVRIRESWGFGHDNVYFLINDSLCLDCILTKSVKLTDMERLYSQRLSEEQNRYRDLVLARNKNGGSVRATAALVAGYTWIVQNTRAQWIIDVSDKSHVRIDDITRFLLDNLDSSTPQFVGPPPVRLDAEGVYGHVVSERLAHYLGKNGEGNDATTELSLLDALDQLPWKHEIQWVENRNFVRFGSCDSGKWLIGRILPDNQLHNCFSSHQYKPASFLMF